jgi:hypothetical protein
LRCDIAAISRAWNKQQARGLTGAKGANSSTRKHTQIRLALAAAALVAVATLGLSAEFYVVQDTSTKKCTIVERKPTTST